MTRSDELWKGLIEDLFPYFIPFFLPEHEPLFDLSRPPEFLDKELQAISPVPAADTNELRFVDKLVKVYTKAGEEKWVLIHIEVQGYQDADFAHRMFHYFYRILDRYKVPVTAIAVFTDSNPAFHPDTYTYDFAVTMYTYRFNTYKVLAQNEAELSASSNPFAIAILTVLLEIRKKKQKLDDVRLYPLKLSLARQLYRHNFSKKTIQEVHAFIDEYVNFASPEMAIKFGKEIEAIEGEQYNMKTQEIALQLKKERWEAWGKEKMEEEIKTKRNTLFVENLLRSTDFSDERIASLADVPVAFVQEIKSKLS